MRRYHGKCLKIARGKVKEDDKYTCPVCDYRVKIPRDAARPRLEELQAWQAGLESLPFQPEEEETLAGIIDTAQAFRDSIRPFCTHIALTSEEITKLRFYLRKVEGADLLLAYETNFLRQELHKWAPVAPEPPPVIQQSGSTRKPRPTKQQKLMASLGITNPDDLPAQYKLKPHKRKSSEVGHTKPPAPLQPAGTSPASQNSVMLPNSSPAQTRPGMHQHQHSGHSTPSFTYPHSGAPHSASMVMPHYRDSPLFTHGSSYAPPPINQSGPLSRPPQAYEQNAPRFDNTVNPAHFSHSAHSFPSHTPPPAPPAFSGTGMNLDPALFGNSAGPSIFDKRPGSAGGSPNFAHDHSNVNFGSSTNSNHLDSIFADMVHDGDEPATLGQESGLAGEAFAASGQDHDGHDDARMEEFVNHH